MKPDVKKRVSEILAGTKLGSSSPMRDVLLILVRFNGSVWKSELVQELGIIAGCPEGEKKPIAWLDRTISDLQGATLVKVEEMMRATMESREGSPDMLISLVDLPATSAVLCKAEKPISKKHKR